MIRFVSAMALRMIEFLNKNLGESIDKRTQFADRSFALSLIGLWLLITGGSWVTATSDPLPAERLELIHADQFEGTTINGQQVRKFEGKVEFRQGTAQMLCQRATQFLDEERVIFEGQVSMVDSGKQMLADKIEYFEGTRRALATGNVKMIDSSKTLTADEIEYFDREEIAKARGHVVLTDEKERLTLTGGRAEYNRAIGYAMVIEHPVLIQSDSTKEKEITITGEIMEMFEDGDRIMVEKTVQITRGEVVAQSDSLEFLRKQNRAILSARPKAQRQNDHLTGKNIELILHGTEVSAIHIVGSAVVTSRVDTLITTDIPYDLLTGDDIMVSIANEAVDTVIVKGKATSYYHVIEESKEKGLNKVLGDEIRMFFANDEMERVDVESAPGSSVGTFYPPNSKSEIETELAALLAKNGVELDRAPAARERTSEKQTRELSSEARDGYEDTSTKRFGESNYRNRHGDAVAANGATL